MPFLAPVFTAISAFAASSAIAGFIVNTALSVGLSVLSQALFGKKPELNRAGMLSDVTTAGGINPQTVILGYCATNGNRVAPYYSHGYDDDTDNEWLTAIIDLADLPIDGIEAVIVDGNEYSILAQRNPGDPNYDAEHDYYGQPLSGKLQDWARFRFHDGTQTTADAKLVERFADYPERPWTSTHVLEGIPYAVMSYRTDPKKEDPVWQGFPEARFVVRGSKLYDPRKDSTVSGGSGVHRWGDKSTWEFTDNPIVMVYNIIRGIELPDGSTFGIGATASSLPLDKWFAAMNVCDEPGTQTGTNWKQDIKRYRAGLEFAVDSEPNEIILTILKSCGGRIVEYGGYYTISVGAPALPSASFDDGSVIADQQRSFDMCVGLNGMFNGVSASYPSPKHKWESSDAVPYHNATWEAEDDGRRLIADLKLASVPFERQVRRLMRELAKDNRRQRQHLITLGPWAMSLLPLDTIRWTSAVNGYINKDFEITGKQIDPRTLNVTINIRERDPADYDADAVFDAITPEVSSNVMVVPTINGVRGLSVVAIALADEDGNPRRPALQISWNPNVPYDGVSYQVRLVTTEAIANEGTVIEVDRGQKIVSSGILPNTNYEVRARAVRNGRNKAWSSWIPVTTASVYLKDADFENGIVNLFEEQGLYPIAHVDALPTLGAYDGQLVFYIVDGKLRKWNASTSLWEELIDDEYIGDRIEDFLDETAFARGISVPRVVSTLPATGIEGQFVTLSSDGKLYRWDDAEGEWTANAPGIRAQDVIGTLTVGQIGAGAIGTDQLAANSVIASHLAIGGLENLFSGFDSEVSSPFRAVGWAGTWGAPTHNGQNSINVTSAGGSTAYAMRPIPVNPGEEYFFSIWVARNSEWNGTPGNSKLRIADQTNTILAAIPYDATVPHFSGGFERRTLVYIVPSGVSELRIILANDSTAGAAFISGMEMRLRNTGELIVDGSVHANKLTANTIIGNNLIVPGTITGGLLATSGIITNTAQIANGLITRAKIENAAINSAKIEDLTVGNIKLADGSVSTQWSKAGNWGSNLTITVPSPSKLIIGFTGTCSTTWAGTIGDFYGGSARLRLNGTNVGESSAITLENPSQVFGLVVCESVSAGSHTVKVDTGLTIAGRSLDFSNGVLFVLAATK